MLVWCCIYLLLLLSCLQSKCAATVDLGGFYGQIPYSQCPPGDPGWTKKCNPALGGDPFLSGCNVNSCEPSGCHAYPGNVTTPGLCMHDPELHLRWLQQGALSHVFRTHCEVRCVAVHCQNALLLLLAPRTVVAWCCMCVLHYVLCGVVPW
jgi:hypothetical protein